MEEKGGLCKSWRWKAESMPIPSQQPLWWHCLDHCWKLIVREKVEILGWANWLKCVTPELHMLFYSDLWVSEKENDVILMYFRKTCISGSMRVYWTKNGLELSVKEEGLRTEPFSWEWQKEKGWDRCCKGGTNMRAELTRGVRYNVWKLG